MPEFARKPAESSHSLHAISGPSPVASIDLASEKHYSIIEIAKLWARRITALDQQERAIGYQQRPRGSSLDHHCGSTLPGYRLRVSS